MQKMLDRLVDVYRDEVQPRMQELPVYNPVLEVETRGFMLRDDHCSGVLITPWCMNLVLLAGEDQSWTGLAPGSAVDVTFPAGQERMTLSLPADKVPHLSLPLFTTVLDFPDQDKARQVADEVLIRLYQTGAEQDLAEPQDTEPGSSVAAGLQLSRRDLLRGRLAPAAGREA